MISLSSSIARFSRKAHACERVRGEGRREREYLEALCDTITHTLTNTEEQHQEGKRLGVWYSFTPFFLPLHFDFHLRQYHYFVPPFLVILF